MIKDIADRWSQRLRTEPFPPPGSCTYPWCHRRRAFHVLISRSAHESARYASLCKVHRPLWEHVE